MYNISTLFIISIDDRKLTKSESSNLLTPSGSICFFSTNIKAIAGCLFLPYLLNCYSISATVQCSSIFYQITCKISRRLRLIPAHSIQIHIRMLPIWKSLRKSVYVVDYKFDETMWIISPHFVLKLEWKSQTQICYNTLYVFYIINKDYDFQYFTSFTTVRHKKCQIFIFWLGDLSNHICNIWLIQRFLIKSSCGSEFEQFAYVFYYRWGNHSQ